MMPKKSATGNGQQAGCRSLLVLTGALGPEPGAQTDDGLSACRGGPAGVGRYGFATGRSAASHAAMPPAISLTSVKPRRCRRLAATDER